MSDQNRINYIEQITTVPEAKAASVEKIRIYTEGKHVPQITEYQLELIGKQDTGYNPILNVCPQIINAHANRLEILSRTVEPIDGVDTAQFDEFNKQIDQIWNDQNLARVATSQMWAGIRDGDSYLIVEYDAEEGATMHFEPAFDGKVGVHVFYTDKNNPQSALYAFKMWKEYDFNVGRGQEITRLNIYWKDRIEYYYQDTHSNWQPYLWGQAYARANGLPVDPNDATGPQLIDIPNKFKPGETFLSAVLYWTTDGLVPSATNAPLGLAVIHYAHNSNGTAKGKSDLYDVVMGDVQDSINLLHANEIVASTLESTRVMYATNYDPQKGLPRTEVHSVPKIQVEAGALLYNTGEGTFGAIEGTDVRPLIQAVDSEIQKAASMTSTPLHFFNIRGQLPAESTQQGLQQALVDKVENSQADLGIAYKRAFQMLYKLHLAFGKLGTSLTPELAKQIDKINIAIGWKPARYMTQLEKFEVAEKEKNLGVPFELYMIDAGKSEEWIDQATKQISQKRSNVISLVSNALDENNNPRQETINPNLRQGKVNNQQVANGASP